MSKPYRFLLPLALLILTGTASADIAPKTEPFGINLFVIVLLLIFFTINACIELVAALIYSLVRGLKKKRTLLAVFIANAVSYPPFFLITAATGHPIPALFVGALQMYRLALGFLLLPSLEAFVILLECYIINRIARIGMRESLFLSLTTNLTSFLLPLCVQMAL